MVEVLPHSAWLYIGVLDRKATGERKQVTEWHRIATSNRLAEIAKLPQERRKGLYRRFIPYT